MRTKRFLIAGALVALVMMTDSARAKETVLYSFQGDADGASPISELVADAAGTIYGTTSSGGIGNNGTVFKLTPPASGHTAWTKTTLYQFDGYCGSGPQGGLLIGKNGRLFGTATNGTFKFNAGSVFMLVPPAAQDATWKCVVIHYFGSNGADGKAPFAGLVSDEAGALYGTTKYGGEGTNSGKGTVFKLTPPASVGQGWKETILYKFAGKADGSNPTGGLIRDANGAFFGTASAGGSNGAGVVFKLTAPSAASISWSESALYSFNGEDAPLAGLIRDTATGVLYGTTSGNFPDGAGTVYSLTPPKAGKLGWTKTILHAFRGGADSQLPFLGQLTFGGSGILYGVTRGPGYLKNDGTVFELIPAATGSSAWKQVILYRFQGGLDGGAPFEGVLLGKSGELYGTTYKGGFLQTGIYPEGAGTVFEILP